MANGMSALFFADSKGFFGVDGFLLFSYYLMAMDGWMHMSVADTPFPAIFFLLFFRFFLHEIVPPIVLRAAFGI